MHTHHATVVWERGEQQFLDRRYSRAHRWRFDGGAEVMASSSPHIVPLPMSVAECVDPEEALVASVSSCHMLFFLSLAAEHDLIVDRYTDHAYGMLGQDSEGRLAMTKIVLRPEIAFSVAGVPEVPDAQLVQELHHEAHARCFIANSLKADIVIES